MRDTMGIILTSNNKISPITDNRAVLALPMAGRFRLIDFIISSMANAGVTNIGVVTESNYSSLMDHVKSGKPWDLDRKKEGLIMLPPNLNNLSYGVIRGDIDMLAGISQYIERSGQTYVILSLENFIYNIDFSEVIKAHKESHADITMVYHDMVGMGERELSRFTLLDIDEDNKVVDIEVNPHYPKSSKASMGLYVMEREILSSIIDECSARGDHDFIKDALAKKLHGLCLHGYEYKGYTDKIDSLISYYKNNMMFLKEDIRTELFSCENPVYTKIKDQSPTRYGENAVVENCFISDGCVIEGHVENCILSRGVKIAEGACVKNSIIMQNAVIEKDVVLEHVVFDKDVKITTGRKLLGQDIYPLAIAKGTVI